MIEPPTPLQAKPVDSDSDSDWDDDDDFGGKKINIKIKPISQVTPGKISASVDELRATVGTWKSLANVNLIKPNSRRHHQSTLQLNGTGNELRATLAPSATSSSMMQTKIGTANGLASPANLFTSDSDVMNTINNNNNDTLVYLNQAPQLTNHEQAHDRSRQILDLSNGLQHLQMNGFEPESPIKQLPVAFAVQECINAVCFVDTAQDHGTNIVGHIRMAVPRSIVHFDLGASHKMPLTIKTDRAWSAIKLNEKLIRKNEDNFAINKGNSINALELSVDMYAVKNYATEQLVENPKDKNYILLPELVKYIIYPDESINKMDQDSTINPLVVSAHQLCENGVTKMRLDIKPADITLGHHQLSQEDIKDLRVILRVSGSILSQQSRPDARWNPVNSELLWIFPSLSNMIHERSAENITSCLARFTSSDLNSRVEEIDLKFSVHGKTISGMRVELNDTQNFRLAKQKFEAKTGTYKCESQPL